jgi:polyhydroxybutyrate depolymerase
MLRSSSLFLALVFALSFLGLVGCGGGGGGTGTAGTNGTAGTTGTAGATAGSAGSMGTAGMTAGSAGSMGTAGMTAGSAGSMGTAGMTAGSAGSMGTAGMTAGSAGAVGTAGVGGSMGTAGAGGTGGSGTAGAMGGVVKSAGCTKANAESSATWNQHNIMVTTVAPAYTGKFTNRIYWTKPPAGYDMANTYNLVIWGQGCGQGPTAENIPPAENPQLSAKSVIVQLLASQMQQNHCYSAGPDGDAADSPEIPYFDQVVAEVEAAFCVDKNKVFMGGYSSGGWESGLMSCVRTNVLRGTGWAAAGLQKNHAPCMGPVAALITRATMDNGTPLDQTTAAVESLRMRNGCATTTKPWMPTWNAGEEKADTSMCLAYDGCMAGYPLVWCPTVGGHTNTEGDTHLTRDGLWKLWSTLP